MSALYTILAALDDYEQVCSDRYEETGDAGHLVELSRASILYAMFDEMRFAA